MVVLTNGTFKTFIGLTIACVYCVIGASEADGTNRKARVGTQHFNLQYCFLIDMSTELQWRLCMVFAWCLRGVKALTVMCMLGWQLQITEANDALVW